MAVTFPRIPLAITVEIALGADLTADLSTFSWTDVSAYALGEVSVTRGRSDRASSFEPSRCTLRLGNTDDRFTPRFPTSPYYPNFRLDTPIRVKVNPGSGLTTRFVGFISSIKVNWPGGNAQFAEVAIEATGVSRRLRQGPTTRSALYRAHITGSPVQYWPLEDASGSTNFAS